MSNRVLKLYKGSTNGISGGILKTIDDDGDVSAYDLTSATSVILEIYAKATQSVPTVTITATVTDASNGVYDAFPPAVDSLDSLTVGGEYYWRTRVKTASDSVGKVFATDTHGRLLPVEVI